MIDQRKSTRSLADETAVLVHELRMISSETVEAILNWRHEKGDKQLPFIWGNHNYLLKMSGDTVRVAIDG